MSKISVYNDNSDINFDPRINVKNSELEEFSIENKKITASFGADGMLKQIVTKSSGRRYPVSIKFVQ